MLTIKYQGSWPPWHRTFRLSYCSINLVAAAKPPQTAFGNHVATIEIHSLILGRIATAGCLYSRFAGYRHLVPERIK